jgi:hypothetical protein
MAPLQVFDSSSILCLHSFGPTGIMKTVPKYITAIIVKDLMEDLLPPVEKSDQSANILRSAMKSVTAGVAGAALTNPFDVLRNE